MIQKTISSTVFIYGVLLLVLAAYGYYATQSQISLIVGLIFGGAITLSALAMFGQNKTGIYVAMILTLALTIVFSIRYSHTAKSLPGIMAVVSGGMLLFLLAQIGKWKK